MYVDFGSRLNNLSDEMCQMNTKIGRITRRKSRLDGFTPSPSLEPTKESSSEEMMMMMSMALALLVIFEMTTSQ